jgi:maleate isomerase
VNISHRIGLVVPPSNPTVEPELHALMPATVAVHASRLPVLPGDLAARNAVYADHYPATLAAFGTLTLDAALIGLTGATYGHGADGDTDLCVRLAAAAGTSVATASLAIREALAALKVKSICLVSPYPQWLTDKSLAYWASAGVAVTQVVKMSEEFRAYQMTTAEVGTALAQVQGAPQAVVLTGTGLITLPAILEAAPRMQAPLLSSNICGAWWLQRALRVAASGTLLAAAPLLARTLEGPDQENA